MLKSLASFDSKLKKLAIKSKNKPSEEKVNDDLDMDNQIEEFNDNIKNLESLV